MCGVVETGPSHSGDFTHVLLLGAPGGDGYGYGWQVNVAAAQSSFRVWLWSAADICRLSSCSGAEGASFLYIDDFFFNFKQLTLNILQTLTRKNNL